MKFRLPFQIYRTGVITRSSSPGNILYKFSKDNEAKVRKKTSKINSSYRAIISNYIYSLTRLTLSKLRNRTKCRSSTKSHKVKIRNEFVFLQEALKENSAHRKARNIRITNEASECKMNSIKCANFMCAKSTAKILLQQKELLCNQKSKNSLTPNPEDEKAEENKHLKNSLPRSVKVEKEIKGASNTTPPPLKKIKTPKETAIREKQKQKEYKWKLNKSEAVTSSNELKRLKNLLQSVDDNRNYKIEKSPPAPIRIDNIMGTPHFPKKLPELPIQVLPKIKPVRPKDAPSLVAPKRKYEASDMTRNYKIVDNVQHSPPRMDNIVGCKDEPKEKSSDTIGSHESFPPNPKISVNKSIPIGEEKDAFLFKLDHVVSDLMPQAQKLTSTLELNKAHLSVSEKIKRFENLIGSTGPHNRNKSQVLKSRLLEEKLLAQGKQTDKILSPKLSAFALSQIRRKYYPSFDKEKSNLSIPVNAVHVMDKNDIRTDTKLQQLYTNPKEKYKNLDDNILDINPSGNIKKKHAKIRNSITSHSGLVKQKDMDVDNSNTDSFGDCSTCSTLETSAIHILTPRVLIPPPSKAATAPENKRNYSSTAIYEYKDALNGYTDLLNSPFTFHKSNLIPTSNLYDYVPPMDRMFSTNIKNYGEINSEVSKAKKRNRTLEPNNNQQDLDDSKQDRRFSSDVFTRNLEDRYDNTNELDISWMSNSNSNMHHTSQRNLIKVTSTLDNQDKSVSPEDGSDKQTRQLSYQNYHEHYCILKNVSDCEMITIGLPENEQNTATHAINSVDVINDRYKKMLDDKKTLINNYIKWKMQLHKFGSPTKISSKPSKCCLNLVNRIYKQNKYKTRKYKIIHEKQKNISKDTLPVQPEQNDSVTKTVNLIKSQVAHKRVLFDKISKALHKKTDMITYSNHTNKEMQKEKERMNDFRHNNKRKLSRVVLDITPQKNSVPDLESKKVMLTPETKQNIPVLETKKILQVQETKNVYPVLETKNVNPVQEAKNVYPVQEPKNVNPVQEAKNVNSVPEARNAIEYMDVDMPPLQTVASVPPSRVAGEVCNKRKTISQASSNKNIYLLHTIKIRPPAIPATIKAKKFLAKIEGEQFGNMLLKKIDKKTYRQKSTRLINSDKIGKYIA